MARGRAIIPSEHGRWDVYKTRVRRVLKAHDNLPVQVRLKEESRHLRSSPPAFRETGASKRGVEPSSGGCKPAVRSMKRSLPRREICLRKERTGSRVSRTQTKAKEGVKTVEAQPRRTQRRRGCGTLVQLSWEQERPVSAPAATPGGRHPRGLGAATPISRDPAKWASAERESERPVVPLRPWQQNHGRGKGPYLVCGCAGGKRR